MMALTIVAVTIRRVGSGRQWQHWWEVDTGGRLMEEEGGQQSAVNGGGDNIGGMPRVMMMLTIIIIAVRRAGSGRWSQTTVEDGW